MNTTVVSDAVVADANTSASPLLVVEDLHTSFSIPRGEVKAVTVSYTHLTLPTKA